MKTYIINVFSIETITYPKENLLKETMGIANNHIEFMEDAIPKLNLPKQKSIIYTALIYVGDSSLSFKIDFCYGG